MWGLGVVLEHVHERYCGQWALDDVSMAVAPAERVTIVGPPANGAGALLALIAARRPPQSGAIRLVGQPALQAIDSELFRARSVASLPAGSALLDGLSVQANLEGPLMTARRSRRERGELLAEALERFDLRDVARRPVGCLEGKRRVRVRLAMALITRPRLLLLDRSIDPREPALLDELLRLQADHEPTVIAACGSCAKGTEAERTIELSYRAVALAEQKRVRARVLAPAAPTAPAGGAPRSLRAGAWR